MRYRFFNWLPKPALVLIGIVFSNSLFAANCPAPKEFQLQRDGYFVTASGWRSENSYKGFNNPDLVFRQVTLAQDANGESKLTGCLYDLRAGQILSVRLLPTSINPAATRIGKNWREMNKTPTTTEYKCVEWSSKQPCEFTFIFADSTPEYVAANPFGTRGL